MYLDFQEAIRNPLLIESLLLSSSNKTVGVDIDTKTIDSLLEWAKKEMLNRNVNYKYNEYIEISNIYKTSTVNLIPHINTDQEKSSNEVGQEFTMKLLNLLNVIGQKLFSELTLEDKILMIKTFGVINLGSKVDIKSIYKIIDG